MLEPLCRVTSVRAKMPIALFSPIVAHYRATLYRELQASNRYEFHFFADLEGNNNGIPVIVPADQARLHACKAYRGPFGLVWQARTVGACLGGRFHAIILLGDVHWLSSWVGAIAARLSGKRVLFWTHGWRRQDQGVLRLIRNTFYHLADVLLLYGDHAREIGIGQGFAPKALHVIYNSLDVEQQSRLLSCRMPGASRHLRESLFGEPDVPVVLAVSRLTAEKRFDLLVRAIGEVNRRHRKVNLLVVGDGPERKSLEALATDESVPTKFVGSCYEESRMSSLFTCASVTVSPGNVGLTCMHSLGYGVPVISHDDASAQNPEWEAIVPGVSGALFPKGSVAGLVAAIEEWTRTAEVPSLVAERCRSIVLNKYYPARQCQAIEAALDQVLA